MIGYYGGSFNPVHQGHLEIAEAIAATPYVDCVRFVPVYSHPLDKTVTSFDHRVKMLEIALKNYEHLEISTIEKERKAVPSYTVDLLKIISAQQSGVFFIAGMDNLNMFFKWDRWQDIVRDFNFTFTSRDGIQLDKTVLSEIQQVSGKTVRCYSLKDFRPGGLSVLTVPDYPVSSTEIRKMLLNREPVSGIIPDEVLTYIDKNNLFIND